MALSCPEAATAVATALRLVDVSKATDKVCVEVSHDALEAPATPLAACSMRALHMSQLPETTSSKVALLSETGAGSEAHEAMHVVANSRAKNRSVIGIYCVW